MASLKRLILSGSVDLSGILPAISSPIIMSCRTAKF
jgi:ABC-type Fe2+-enterobactin transport system substrate-binding protein